MIHPPATVTPLLTVKLAEQLLSGRRHVGSKDVDRVRIIRREREQPRRQSRQRGRGLWIVKLDVSLAPRVIVCGARVSDADGGPGRLARPGGVGWGEHAADFLGGDEDGRNLQLLRLGGGWWGELGARLGIG
jgi:hypothetical protein